MIDSLATWNPLCHHNVLDIEENKEHGLEFRTTLKTSLFALDVFGDIQ